jgi:hypothetical protein
MHETGLGTPAVDARHETLHDSGQPIGCCRSGF